MPSRGLAGTIAPTAERAIEADGFAVQHFVLDDMPCERGVFRWPAEPRRKRNLRSQRLARLIRQQREHRRVEGPGRDRTDANTERREVARDRQRQADDASLRCRVGGLTDLTVERRD